MADGLIHRIRVERSDRTITAEFYDFGADIVIERPPGAGSPGL